MGASDRRKLWICRFAWTTQTRCPHTHSSDRKKRRKRLEDSFEEEENRNGRRLYTLIPKAPGPTDGVHLNLRKNLQAAFFSFFCRCCGYVGNAFALSKRSGISTASAGRSAVAMPLRHTFIGCWLLIA